jgi:hypothetical protein
MNLRERERGYEGQLIELLPGRRSLCDLLSQPFVQDGAAKNSCDIISNANRLLSLADSAPSFFIDGNW